MNRYNQHLSGGIIIYPQHLEKIEKTLSDLTLQIPGIFVMVSDNAGQNIASAGKVGDTNLVTLGALIASDMAAGQEIARVTGEDHLPKMILHEGPQSHQFISEAGRHLILFARVPAETPLGLSRNYIKQTAHQLDEIAKASTAEQEGERIGLGDQELGQEVGNALEDLWSR
jgi:predicted regulator of Ras-like GTPase activity (Roadblock/LC7/MglB family)